MPPLGANIKVLIVDDSAIVRKILSETMAAEPGMEVVGTAPDALIAHEKILALKPDVITLDIEMPHMDGLTFLRRLMQQTPIPTIIISSFAQSSCAATLDALRIGAVEVIAKPAGVYSVGDLRHSLAHKIRAAAASRLRIPRDAYAAPAPSSLAPLDAISIPAPRSPAALATPLDPRLVIAIGASTGGTIAIQEILTRLPADMPPIVITQHIPAGFSRAFAERLNRLCALDVREAVPGDVLRRGLVLLAPGDFHLQLRRSGQGYAVELDRGPQICYQRPSVDVMFCSVALATAGAAIGLLLTGMGTDGAVGMLALKRAGAATIAQDEASCVVYGMPREAVRLGAVDTVASLNGIPATLVRAVKSRALAAAPATSVVPAAALTLCAAPFAAPYSTPRANSFEEKQR